MKKLIFFVSIMFLSINATTLVANSGDIKHEVNNNSKTTTSANNDVKADVALMNNRVEEIKKMDKSALTITEKRELKNELKAIKHNLRRDNGVIYISGSTILIIILLIILL